MSVQIHINGENAAEAVQELATLAASLAGGQAVTVVNVAPEATKPARQSRAASKPETVKADEPAVTPDSEPAQEPDAPSDDDAPVVTVEQLRAKAAAVSQAGKQADVKQLLTDFKAASISTVPEEQRADFLKALEAL